MKKERRKITEVRVPESSYFSNFLLHIQSAPQ